MAKKATVKAAPATAKSAKSGEEAELSTAIVAMPKAGALSRDVGIQALNYLSALATDEQMIDELREGKESNRGKAQVLLMMACHKAGLADKSINLTHAVTGNKSQKGVLANQIRLAIGLMNTTDAGKPRWTPEANAIMNAVPGDDARALKRKESVRTNFSTMLTKSMRVALHAIENNLVVTPEDGYVRLTDSKKSGGAMLKHFGAASVLLNEDQNAPVLDKKGKPTGLVKPLKVKPSFTEIMREAGKSHGVAIVQRKDSRVTAMDPIKHVVEVAENLQKAINNLPSPVPEPVVKALTALRNAIDKTID